jgi:hypothetical protein
LFGSFLPPAPCPHLISLDGNFYWSSAPCYPRKKTRRS